MALLCNSEYDFNYIGTKEQMQKLDEYSTMLDDICYRYMAEFQPALQMEIAYQEDYAKLYGQQSDIELD